MWPWHVKMTTQTCWGCYCCSCWWWGTCWLRLWSPILVKMFKFTFCWYLVETLKLVLDQDSEDVWSRNYFGKQNSTLGSVVPLAMFFLYTQKISGWTKKFPGSIMRCAGLYRPVVGYGGLCSTVLCCIGRTWLYWAVLGWKCATVAVFCSARTKPTFRRSSWQHCQPLGRDGKGYP